MTLFLYKMYLMNNEIEINDIREKNEFKGTTFSKFNKSAVKKELLKSLLSSKIESACNWSAELICAGHYSDLWDTILTFYSKYIQLGNPKLSIYIELRINSFKDIIKNGYIDKELQLRNNMKIRKLFCELICMICEAERKHPFEELKLNSEDFDIVNITDKLKAPNVSYLDNVFLTDDPKQLYISINELSYNLSKDGKNIIKSCFWMEWILAFKAKCKSQKKLCLCERRSWVPVEPKYQIDPIWIIWDIFIKEGEKRSSLLKKIIKSLLSLFTLKYSENNYKKRKFIMYMCISLIVEDVNLDKPLVSDEIKTKIANITKNINSVYKNIKENEESPDTDYLFQGLNQSNLEKSIEKMDKMKNLEDTYIPRI